MQDRDGKRTRQGKYLMLLLLLPAANYSADFEPRLCRRLLFRRSSRPSVCFYLETCVCVCWSWWWWWCSFMAMSHRARHRAHGALGVDKLQKFSPHPHLRSRSAVLGRAGRSVEAAIITTSRERYTVHSGRKHTDQVAPISANIVNRYHTFGGWGKWGGGTGEGAPNCWHLDDAIVPNRPTEYSTQVGRMRVYRISFTIFAGLSLGTCCYRSLGFQWTAELNDYVWPLNPL